MSFFFHSIASQPTNVSVGDETETTAKVSYETDGSLYRVQAVITNLNNGETMLKEVPAGDNMIPLDGLAPGTDYKVVLRGVTKDGRISDATDEVTFKTGKFA